MTVKEDKKSKKYNNDMGNGKWEVGLGGRERVPWNIVAVSSVTLQYEHHVLRRAAMPDSLCDVLLGRGCRSPSPLCWAFSRRCFGIQSSNWNTRRNI